MTTEIDLELVRELNPAEEGPSAQTRERARAALLAEVAREREPRRRPTRPRFGVRLGLAGAAVVAVALVLLLVGTRGGVVRPDRAAAALLRRGRGVRRPAGAASRRVLVRAQPRNGARRRLRRHGPPARDHRCARLPGSPVLDRPGCPRLRDRAGDRPDPVSSRRAVAGGGCEPGVRASWTPRWTSGWKPTPSTPRTRS